MLGFQLLHVSQSDPYELTDNTHGKRTICDRRGNNALNAQKGNKNGNQTYYQGEAPRLISVQMLRRVQNIPWIYGTSTSKERIEHTRKEFRKTKKA